MTLRSRLWISLLLALIAGSTSTGAQKPPEPPARLIAITVSDPVDGKMSYSLGRINAKPGERLRIRLTSIGTLPKVVMAHNFVLLRVGVDPKGFTDEAAFARDTDFIPASRKAQVVAHTALVGPGEADEVTFTVPKVAGNYPYVCSFAGHFAAGMVGEMIVK